MKKDSLAEILEYVPKKIKEVFEVTEPTPKVEFTDEIDFRMESAFCYTVPETEPASILLNKNWYEEATYPELHWAISEEVSHFCHYTINRELFEKYANTSEEGNNKALLEMANLKELVARLGGFCAGYPPPDFGKTLDTWMEVMNGPYDDMSKFLATERVWGTSLGDYIISHEHSGSPFLPNRELIRALAKCNCFVEAAETFQTYEPDSPSVKEMWNANKTIFRMAS